MHFEERRQRAMAVLRRHGIPQHSSEPVQLRLFRKLGMEVRPLHFESFWRTTLVSSLWFGPFWALFMWFFRWREEGMGLHMAVLAALIVGLCFGLSMAAYYAWVRRKHKLPSWESLGS